MGHSSPWGFCSVFYEKDGLGQGVLYREGPRDCGQVAGKNNHYPLILSIEIFLGEESPGFSPSGSSARCEEESQGWGEYAGGAVDLTGE